MRICVFLFWWWGFVLYDNIFIFSRIIHMHRPYILSTHYTLCVSLFVSFFTLRLLVNSLWWWCKIPECRKETINVHVYFQYTHWARRFAEYVYTKKSDSQYLDSRSRRHINAHTHTSNPSMLLAVFVDGYASVNNAMIWLLRQMYYHKFGASLLRVLIRLAMVCVRICIWLVCLLRMACVYVCLFVMHFVWQRRGIFWKCLSETEKNWQLSDIVQALEVHNCFIFTLRIISIAK